MLITQIADNGTCVEYLTLCQVILKIIGGIGIVGLTQDAVLWKSMNNKC